MPLANALPLLIQATVSGIVMIRCYGELVSLYSLSTYTQITPLTVFLVQLLYVSISPLNTGLLLVLSLTPRLLPLSSGIETNGSSPSS